MPRPACTSDINLSATKNPDLVRKPLAVGSDKSQICSNKYSKISSLKIVIFNLFVFFNQLKIK